MGIFQNLLETYDKCALSIGIIQTDAEGFANEKKTLLPIFHMTFKSEICIVVDGDGIFISATRNNKEKTIIIPCTEGSSGRANTIAPHPLCDQLDYVGGFNQNKTKAYLKELNEWKGSNLILNAIFTYVNSKTMLLDLTEHNIFKENEFLDETGDKDDHQLDIEKIRKIGVCFAVNFDNKIINVWENNELRNEWVEYIKSKTCSETNYFDYINGESVSQIAMNHPKNINPMSGNAKMVSCNDSSGFTFRGRFDKQNDAIILDYVLSQKMHQMLKWLIANYGYKVDSQVIITWAVDSNTEVKEKAQDNSFNLFEDMEAIETHADILTETNSNLYANYALKLKNLLQGYGKIKDITVHSREICIAIFDAATTGRMGLVFYQELQENCYLENIVNWHNDTSYHMTHWIKEKDESGKYKNKEIKYIGAPSFDDILFAIYGQSRGDKSYDVLKKKTRKQLFECMFGNFSFPENLVKMAANRSSSPMSFIDTNGKFNEYNWKKSINITCALARKYYKYKKEEIGLELDENRRDRDYLYGRLLAIADKMEAYALYKSGAKRPTNAVKLMSAFQIKPYTTWGQLFTQLLPYKNQLGGAGYYQSLIDGVMALFREGEYETNSPLSPLYLLGYSAQNRVLSQSIKIKEVDENVNIAE